MDIDIFNPFKNNYGINNKNISLNKTFNQLSKKHKAITVVATAIVAIFTLGICAYSYARLLVGRLKKLEEIEDNQTALRVDKVTSNVLKPVKENLGNTSETVFATPPPEPNLQDLQLVKVGITDSNKANTNIEEPDTNIEKADAKVNEQKQKKEMDHEVFLKYQQEQGRNQLPVDLILCRGREVNSDSPNLLSTRSIHDREEKIAYNPLHVDINKQSTPDIQADITSKDMECFPDSSIDDIFIERLAPGDPLLDIYTYFNITRILKVNGTLVMDVYALCDNIQIDRVRAMLLDLFKHCHIPLGLSLSNPRRNDDRFSQKFIFYKTAEFDTSDKEYILKQGRTINFHLINHLKQYINKTNNLSRHKNPGVSFDQLGQESLQLFNWELRSLESKTGVYKIK